MSEEYSCCTLCPRECRVDRRTGHGLCASGDGAVICRVSRHRYEEPAICGDGGAGTVFFSGCNLGCVYCQNSVISRKKIGERVSDERLAEIFLDVAKSGVSTLDLVTPTHFTPSVCHALAAVKDKLGIPVVWNSGGYESVKTLESLRGLVDIYLPDFKYYSSELALKYSSAPDYAERAAEAIAFMREMLGPVNFSHDGKMLSGVMVRHLVLPGCRTDSIAVLRTLARVVPPDEILISLMSQYTPDFYLGEEKNLKRRLTTFEYQSVSNEAIRLGFDGYMQSPSSASAEYTPPFTDKLVIDLS